MSLQYDLTQLLIQNTISRNNTSLKTMKSNIRKFSTFCMENGYNKLRKIESIGKEKILQEYADKLVKRGLSPATIHTYLASPCKALSIPMNCIQKPKRTSDSITRSRDAFCNPQGKLELLNPKFDRVIEFQKAVGIRRHELSQLKGRHLVHDESGKLCIEVERGKYYPTLYNKHFHHISCRLKEVPA